MVSGSISHAALISRIGVLDIDAIDSRFSDTNPTTAAPTSTRRSMPMATEMRRLAGSFASQEFTVE